MPTPITFDAIGMPHEWHSGDLRHLMETVPDHYFNQPPPFPTQKVGYRKLAPLLRQYLKAVLDPVFRENHVMQWSCYVVALGKMCDLHRDTVTSKVMRHELGTKRPILLAEFIETWDSIPGPIPGVK